ncbi:uncharacterized protein ATC70_011266 [Mucor velutinosus]|uniref:Uncharacterized protein n=1 Tax=Mucor velutinosus TaxID=708070 RepID=A0AAN7DJV5_9FUNG|nr:hypothetical protein ATC70_011266 [Mucor velutinosus]
MDPLDVIKESLFLRDYWISQEPLSWEAIGYLTSLIEKAPTTDKRSAFYNLSQDLEKLYTAFIDDSLVKKHIQGIKKSLNLSSGRGVINEFWEKHATTLKDLSLKNRTSQSVVLSSMMKTAAFAAASAADAHSSSSTAIFADTAHSPSSSAAATAHSSSSSAVDTAHSSSSSAAAATQFSTNKRSDQTHIETRRQKRRSQQSNNDISESDNFFVAGQDASVGTIIKKGAIDMHSKLLLKQALTARQRKIMTNGLSSIVDLSDNSLASQRSLFTESEWSELQLLFDERLKIVPIDLNERVKDVIIIVGGTLGLSGDYDCCISLVRVKRRVQFR